MTYSFNDSFRREVASRCAAFSRLPENDSTRGLKHSAVAIALTDTENGSGEAAFLMTRRTRDLRAHRGQWALPGGRCDEGETSIEAALRELDEEISLRLDASDVLGLLDDYATRSGYLITPVVVWAGSSAPLQLEHLGGREGLGENRVGASIDVDLRPGDGAL